ncbi:hypothetical protein KSS87_014137 [Heliosperma pusillum]|nr:hypothetical protein KSS87_014137 [Heliosperma pusillum]
MLACCSCGILQTVRITGRDGDHEEEDEEEEEGDMEVDAAKGADEVALAAAAAEALGKNSDDIADALRELDMDNYDDDGDDGIEVFSKGLGDAFYPSNELDPYLKDKADDDSEEEADMIIKAEDSVIVCARNDEELSQLEEIELADLSSVFTPLEGEFMPPMTGRCTIQTFLLLDAVYDLLDAPSVPCKLLDVYILEETEDGPNMYIHHDIIISAFPLCTAWLDCPLKGGERGNFIAVGSMEPSIEIWDLDTIDEVEPALVLGGVIEKKKKKKGKKKSIKYKEDSHTDSVLGLAWNKEFRNILASASADKRVKIWDIATGKCSITMEHHTDKVQTVAFSHHVPQILLSGSFDHSIVMVIDLYLMAQLAIPIFPVSSSVSYMGVLVEEFLSMTCTLSVKKSKACLSEDWKESGVLRNHVYKLKDGRNPSHSGYRWAVEADVESLSWDPHTEHNFIVSLENGMIQGFDIRAASSNSESDLKPSFTIHAHEKAASSISYNFSSPNLLASGSVDKTVKLWDLSNNQPSCVASKNPKAGAVFAVSFSVENPFLLAIGGSKGKLEVWDTLSEAGVAKRRNSTNAKSH